MRSTFQWAEPTGGRAGRPRVIIVGAGFAGLEAARELRAAPVEVLLIDRTNYHTFHPLLYQVVTAGLEPGEVAHTVRGTLQDHPRFRWKLIGFRNRLAVMLDWVYNYFTYDRRARLIFEADTESPTSVHQSTESHGRRV